MRHLVTIAARAKAIIKEEMMSQENSNTEISVTRSTADGTKRPSEDARDLGPMQAGLFVIGRMDKIVGEGGVEVPGYVVTKYSVCSR